MLKKEIFSILKFKAISPIHAGSGFTTSSVDLPIQRERHTGWPHIQASAVKGAMRDHFRKQSEDKDKEVINYIFGSDRNNDKNIDGANDGVAGVISISDAKLLFFPMRSNIAPFVYVTSPSVLKRLNDDLYFVGLKEKAIKIDKEIKREFDAFSLLGDVSGKVILEDIGVDVENNGNNINELSFIKDLEKVILVSDEVFDYCVTSCTEVQTQITIDSSKGVTKDGSLRYQELLPSDTVLYSIIYISNGLKDDLKAENIYNYLRETIKDYIQIGGDETLGRGICKIEWIDKSNNNGGRNE